MKTYLLDIPNQIKNWSNALDAKTILCRQAWSVFNDEGVKEVYIFQNDGTLIVSQNGKVTKAKWEYLVVNSCLIIDSPNAETYMLRPSYYDEKVLALNVDGTNRFALMVSENWVKQLMLETLEKVNAYIAYNTRTPEEIQRDNRKKKREEYEKRNILEKEWEKYIERKTDEYLSSPEGIGDLEAEKSKKKYICIFSFIVFISGIVISVAGNDITIFAAACAFSVVMFMGALMSGSLRQEIINKMERKYPFSKFRIEEQ